MHATGSSTGFGELTRRPEKKGTVTSAASANDASDTNHGKNTTELGTTADAAHAIGNTPAAKKSGGSWGNSFSFATSHPSDDPSVCGVCGWGVCVCAVGETSAPHNYANNAIRYKYFDVSLSEAAVSTLRLLVNCYPSHPVSHHINDSSMEPRTIYLLGQCGAVELVLRLLTLFVDSVKSRNLVKSRFDKITQQLTKNMGAAGGRTRDYKRAVIVEEEEEDDDNTDDSSTVITTRSAASASVAASEADVSIRSGKSQGSAQTEHTLRSISSSHTPAFSKTANTTTSAFLMYKHRPSAFASVGAITGPGPGIAGIDDAAANAAANSGTKGSGGVRSGAVTADNLRDTRTIYSALECLYCLSSKTYKHPNRAILEANHALDQVLMACDVLAGEAVVFHWACTLIGLLYSKRVAKSHVNGRLCRLLIQVCMYVLYGVER